MIEAAAVVATTLLAGLAVFQALLVIGKPLGRYAWGGSHDVLPKHLRIASAFSILLYLFFSLIILNQAGVYESFGNVRWVDTASWVLTGYFTLGIFLNAISRSKPERMVMTPIVTALAVTILVVSLSG